MGPATLGPGSHVDSPSSLLPEAGFFGDTAVRAVAKQNQLVQSLGPSAKEAARRGDGLLLMAM